MSFELQALLAKALSGSTHLRLEVFDLQVLNPTCR
jgi:hypothetical protein